MRRRVRHWPAIDGRPRQCLGLAEGAEPSCVSGGSQYRVAGFLHGVPVRHMADGRTGLVLIRKPDHQRQRSVQGEHRWLVQATKGSTTSVPADRHDLVHHDVRWTLQPVCRRRHQCNPEEWRVTFYGRHETEQDAVGMAEFIGLYHHRRPLATGVRRVICAMTAATGTDDVTVFPAGWPQARKRPAAHSHRRPFQAISLE
jgi:hypothetical protein